MFNANNGYIGYSRSVRANEALKDYRYPLARFDRVNIDIFLYDMQKEDLRDSEESEHDKIKEKYKQLKKLPLRIWKYVAKDCVGTAEWHHMGCFFNEVDFYDLRFVLDYINDNLEELKKLKPEKKTKEKPTTFLYAWVTYPEWGGSLRHPKIINWENEEGVIIGDWFYLVGRSKKNINSNNFDIIMSSEDFKTFKKFMVKNNHKTHGKRALDKIAKAHLK